jgi:predicted O-linked N-acetylglucosamine transferase (SPINDLY family)
MTADAWVREAQNHLGKAQYAEAERCLREALKRDPQHAEAWHRLGVVALSAGHVRDAEQLIGMALARAPGNASAHANLGIALNAQRRYAEAVASYRRALEHDPKLESAHLNQAGPLQALGRIDEAVAVLEAARALNDQRAETFNNLGNLYKDQGRFDEALEAYDRALALNPLLQEAFSNKLAALKLAQGWSAQAIFDAHRRWSAWFEAVRQDYEPLANAADPGRRLKLGYVSPDCHTALPAFIRPVWRSHDAERFTLYAYFNNAPAAEADPQIKSRVNVRVMAGMSDADVARQIRADGIDILIDLAGHTGKNRLGVFARRAAPVQVTWLDYLATTGLEAMDFRITDAVADPPGVTETAHSETLWRMPATQWCWEPPASAPDVVDAPVRANGFVTFGSFNNYSKLTDRTLALWRELMTQLPVARLLVAGAPEGKARDRITTLLGPAAARVEFLPRVPEHEYRAAIGRVDIALDPTPFSGATTTLDALWQGVPVLTCGGPFSWSRSTASLLKALALDEWSVDESEFVARALHWAARADDLATLRRELRGRVAGSAIMDSNGFTQALERRFQDAWGDWCSRRNAATIGAASHIAFDKPFAHLQRLNQQGNAAEAMSLALNLYDVRPSCKLLHAEIARAALGWARSNPTVEAPVAAAPGTRISFVICSIRPDRYAAITTRLKALFAGHEIEIVGIHDAKSLCEGYNRGAVQTTGEVLVFCHDDIDLREADFAGRLLAHLQATDLVGVAGTSKLVSGNWEHAGPPHLHGFVVHQPQGETGWTCYVSGLQRTLISGVQALDGVFMACKRGVWESLRFDEATFDGFHLYDVDFSYRAFRAGFKTAVASDLLLVHYSLGNYDPAWQRFNLRFLQKHRELSGIPSADRVSSLNLRLQNLEQVVLLRRALAHWRFGEHRPA